MFNSDISSSRRGKSLLNNRVRSGVGSMDRFIALQISLLLLAVVSSHAATLPPQVAYWNSVLPNTPMPTAIRDLINPDVLAEEKTRTSVTAGKGGIDVYTPGGNSVTVGGGGVHVSTGKGKPGGGTSVNVGHGGVNVNTTGKGKPGGGTSVNVGHGGVNVDTGNGKPGGGTSVNVGHGGVNVHTGRKPGKPPVVVNVRPWHLPFFYKYAASETQIHEDPNVALFFLEKDLRSGAKMNLRFTKTISGATSFIPRREAQSIPFSSTKLPEILNYFSIAPNSVAAETMKRTLQECEAPAIGGEKKYCATSLESMVEFSTMTLGTRRVKAVSTTVSKEEKAPQSYTITGVRKMAVDELVACHAEPYAYAVFFCHATSKSKAYGVDMVGTDGAKVEALAVCHTDTKQWNPDHVAFKVLKVKPDTVPICHFLPQDHVVWVHSN